MHMLKKQESGFEQSLSLDRSLSAMKDDLQNTVLRAQRSMEDRETVGPLLTTLDVLLRMNARLQLSLQLFLDPSIVSKSIKDEILSGNILDAYKSFAKVEKCRNDLLELCEDDDFTVVYEFIVRCFSKIEETAENIRDIIKLTLASSMDMEIHIGEQINEIIKLENKLDELCEMLKGKGRKGLFARPRKWSAAFLAALEEQVQRGRKGVYKDIQETLEAAPGSSEEGISYSGILPEEDGYREELKTLKKYFADLQNKESQFESELNSMFAIENIYRQSRESLEMGNFLRAYERLAVAESIRYHLLAEAAKHENVTFIENIIEKAFDPMEGIYDDYKSKVNYYCQRALDIMRNEDREPRKQLEVVLSIIELDEKIDAYYSNANVKVKTRPHKWREHFFQMMEHMIKKRIGVYQIEDKSVNENWITRYLEICRMFIVDDLRAAKQFLRVFPKEHQLYDRFVLLYHQNIRKKLHEIAANDLEKREIVQLLNWVRNYTGEEMLGHPFLQINAPALVEDYPLIPQEDVLHLHKIFLQTTEKEVTEWATKAIKQQFSSKEKNLREFIETDQNGLYYTQLPYMLFSIIADQLTLGKEIDEDMVPKILDMCLTEYIKISAYFERSIVKLKNKCYEDKEHLDDFTTAIITIANDLDMCVDSTEALRKYIPEDESINASSSDTPDDLIVPQEPLTVFSAPPAEHSGTVAKKSSGGMKFAIRDAISALKEIAVSKMPSSSSATSLMSMGREDARKSYIDPDTKSLSAMSEGAFGSRKDSAETSSLFGFTVSRKRTTSSTNGSQLTTSQKLEKLKEAFRTTLRMVIGVLYQEVYEDLDDLFEVLLTKQWLKSPATVETICETILDYYSDYRHLRPQVRLDLLMCILFKFVSEYLVSIASREITCTNYEKRCAIAKTLLKDVERINQTFDPMLEESNIDDTAPKLTNVLKSIGELIRLKDKGMISLEIASLIRDYPDMPREIVFAIIDVRDDITSYESWALVDDCMKMVEKGESDPIFSHLFQMSRAERKTSQIIKVVVPRLRRRVKATIAH